jgi:hypothetical protein
VAQPGRAPGSGPGGRRFKSSRPDFDSNRYSPFWILAQRKRGRNTRGLKQTQGAQKPFKWRPFCAFCGLFCPPCVRFPFVGQSSAEGATSDRRRRALPSKRETAGRFDCDSGSPRMKKSADAVLFFTRFFCFRLAPMTPSSFDRVSLRLRHALPLPLALRRGCSPNHNSPRGRHAQKSDQRSPSTALLLSTIASR